jgi:hypothetical protein
VFGAGTSDAGNNGLTNVVTPTGETGSLWLFIPVVFGLGLLATGIISARRHNGDMRERGEGTMQTIEKVEPVEAPFDNEILTLKRRNRWLAWLAGILAMAVVGGGIWFAVTQSGDGSALPSEVSAVLDGYADAMNAHDGPAAMAFTTTDYTLVDNGEVIPRLVAAGAISSWKALDFRVEPEERTVIGDGPYYVTQTARIYGYTVPVAGFPGASVFTIVEEDGAWKIQQQVWTSETRDE